MSLLLRVAGKKHKNYNKRGDDRHSHLITVHTKKKENDRERIFNSLQEGHIIYNYNLSIRPVSPGLNLSTVEEDLIKTDLLPDKILHHPLFPRYVPFPSMHTHRFPLLRLNETWSVNGFVKRTY